MCISISMCFVHWWRTGFVAIAVAEELSVNKEVVGTSFISFNRCCSHVISHDVCASVRYSASAEDLDTVCCFLVCHETS